MWLRIPSTCSPSPLAPVDLSSLSSSQWERLASSVLWRSKPRRLQSWQRGWTKAPWMTRLSGLTLEPSQADAFVDSWISSQRATRANRNRSPENGSAEATLATCGPTSGASSCKPARKRSSSKTSTRTSPAHTGKHAETFSDLVVRLRKDCGRRLKRARRSSAPAFSSWPSATAVDSNGARNRTSARKEGSAHHDGVTLNDAALMWAEATLWPSAQAHDASSAKTPAQIEAMREATGAGVSNLNEAAEMWATPQAHERSFDPRAVHHGAQLANQVETWAAPTSRDWKVGELPNRNGKQALSAQAELWSTPRASDGEKGSPEQNWGGGGIPLPSQAATWATITPADVMGGRTSRSGDRKDEVMINGQAEALSLSLTPHLVPEITPGGSTSSKPAAKRLSPRFVEWLMGWPDGWTAYAPVGTEFTRWLELSRSALSQLALQPVEMPERQLSFLEAMNG